MKAASGDTWFIFTDACYEKSDGNRCGLGGVLVNHNGQAISFFSTFLVQEQLVLEATGETQYFSKQSC